MAAYIKARGIRPGNAGQIPLTFIEQEGRCGESVGCDCGGACEPQSAAESILILGPGCKNCQALEANTRTALEQMGDTTSTIGHVTDFGEIAKYGVMSTPGLVVDGKVVSYGKVLKPEDIVTILKKVRG